MSWSVIGQEEAVGVLRRAVEDESRLSHAYLFVGPERTGKATAARQFAQALNCEDGDPPCGECRSCRTIAEDKHPDVEWVAVGGVCDESEHRDHATDNSRDIRICQVRHVQHSLRLGRHGSRYQVIVVDPADALTNDAANAFLKSLEEPEPNSVIILITSREELLPETVRSRCRRVSFGGVAREAIEGALQERWGATAEQAAHLARLSQGRLGWAVAALQDEKLLLERERVVDEIEALMSGGLSERFAYAASLGSRYSRDPELVRSTLEAWREWWRDVLLVASGKEELVSDTGRLDTLRSLAAQWGVQGAVRALTAVGDGRQHLEERASPTLALEVMLLEVPLSARRS